MVSLEKSYLNHITESKTLSGTAKSRYQPFTLARKIMFNEIVSRPLRGYVDCEDCIEALVDYIRKATGKTVRITVPMRNLLVHMYSLRHQYKDGGLVSMSSVFAGKNTGHAMDHFRSLLEESGLIKMESGDWAYNPMDRQRNRAPKYRFTPEFVSLLGLIHQSFKNGKATRSFAIDSKPIRNVSIRFMLQRSTKNCPKTCASTCDSPSIPSIISVKAGATQTAAPETVETQGVTDAKYTPRKLMPESERKMRDKKLQNLWKGMSLSDMKKAGLSDKCRFQSVSPGMGEEVDDWAIRMTLSSRYREDLYARIVREADAHLPDTVKDPRSGRILSTRTSWTMTIERDRHGNVTSIGTRPINDLCATRNEAHEGLLGPDEASRICSLEALALPHHFDVHCSIHNIGRALMTGEFENSDVYAAVASRLGASRSDVKAGFMHGVFSTLAEYCARHPDSEKASQRVHHEGTCLPFTYRQIQDAMKAEKVPINGRYTEIFWHEAFIYDLVRLYLAREQNIPSIRVYDSFYTAFAIDETEFVSLINRAINDYLHILAHNDTLLSIRL